MAFEKFNLTGKTALITGAGGLLGVEHAAALLESGAKVILTDIQHTILDSALNKLSRDYDSANIMSMYMDVSLPTSVNDVAYTLAKRGQRVDILINNAAIDPKVKTEHGILEASRLESFRLDEWNKQVAVGLTGAFLCSQIFGKGMVKDGMGGVILNIASDLSVIAPDQRLYCRDGLDDDQQPVKPVTYSVIKTGLIGLTRYISTYWAEQGIRCNALSPGGVYNGQNEDFVKRMSSLIPNRRMAKQDEYRAAIQFLCSDASSYMNGQNVIMDGGRSVL